MKRTTSKDLECPRCRAEPEKPCMSMITPGLQLTHPHPERVTRAVALSPPRIRRSGRAPHALRGKRFGPLKVVQRWGSQSSNIAWVYWCRACGHVGKRLGIALVRQGDKSRCPSCKATGSKYGYLHKKPDLEQVQAVMDDAPPDPPPRRLRVTKSLERCTVAELSQLGERIRIELKSRAGEVVHEEG